jgi:hypothetical protein
MMSSPGGPPLLRPIRQHESLPPRRIAPVNAVPVPGAASTPMHRSAYVTGMPPYARADTSAHGSNHLPDLVARIATGDRSAFRCLYGFLAMRVWREASLSLPHPVDSQVVTRSTFVDVWHLARYHLDDSELETDAWIAAITVHHVEERLRSIDRPNLARDDHDRHTYREFAAMISGTGARSGPERNLSGPYRAPP